jgi:hypothetical protein
MINQVLGVIPAVSDLKRAKREHLEDIIETLPWVAITSALRRAMTVNTTTSIAKARLIANGLPALNSCIVSSKTGSLSPL